MDTPLLVLLIIATIGLTYVFAVKIARAAGTEYPESVRMPGIVAAVSTFASGTITALYLLGYLGRTLGFEIALSLGLAITVASLGVIGSKL